MIAHGSPCHDNTSPVSDRCKCTPHGQLGGEEKEWHYGIWIGNQLKFPINSLVFFFPPPPGEKKMFASSDRFCDCVLSHGLTGTETAGDRRSAALCDREQGIQDTLSGFKRAGCRMSFLIRSGNSDRPFLVMVSSFTLSSFNSRVHVSS